MADHTSAHLDLREFARARGGVFTRSQAEEIGLTGHQFRRGKLHGDWVSYRGVWQLAGAPDSHLSRLCAALLCAGPTAAATALSALRLLHPDTDTAGLAQPINSHAVYLSAYTGTHLRLPNVTVLRETHVPEKHLCQGLPTVSRERAIVDTVRVLGWDRSKTLFFRAIQLEWITPEEVHDATSDLRRCRGNRALKLAVAAAFTGSHSVAEQLAHRILKRNGMSGFRANHRVYDDGGLIGVVDMAFLREKLAIEIDGRAWHSDSERFQRDRQRRNRLVNAGWTVLQFTWEDINSRPGHVAETVQTALHRAGLG